MKIHELKTWPTYWDAVARGEKLFEVRRNDRFFQAGDLVHLLRYGVEWVNKKTTFIDLDDYAVSAAAAPRLAFRIGGILQGGQFGIEPGYCVFSLLPIEQKGSPSDD